MDSIPHVSFPATKETQTSSGYLLIRAPLSPDSDFDYKSNDTESSIGGSSLNNYENNIDSDQLEFYSGDDEFDNSSERGIPLVGDSDEESNGNISESYKIYKVNNKDDSDNDNDNDDSLENSLVDEEESGVGIGFLGDFNSNQVVVPIAQVSRDDEEFSEMFIDDDEMVTDVDEYGEFTGVVKVPASISVLDRGLELEVEATGKHVGDKVCLYDESVVQIICRSSETASPSLLKVDFEDQIGTAASEQIVMDSDELEAKELFDSAPSNVIDIFSKDDLSDEEKKILEKLQLIRVKFLRLVHRLGHSPTDPIVTQVLYRLDRASGNLFSQEFSLESAMKAAMKLEAEDKDDLDFSLNVLVLGKTGVGKSASINSIFREQKSRTDPFEPATTAVKEIVGTFDGVKIRLFDTPGLRSPVTEATNRKLLASIKRFIRKFPPDVVLYVDRLDTHDRDLSDFILLKSLTDSLGLSIWKNAILTLTHAASACPEGPLGEPLSFEAFVAQRSQVVHQAIRQAVGDPSMMRNVALVENHREFLLPNGKSWRSQLLLLCYSLMILSEALSKPQAHLVHHKLFGSRLCSPPLLHLLSSLFPSRPHPKLRSNQGDDDDNADTNEADRAHLLDMVLPLSFDGDNPTYRYRFSDSSSHSLVKPVLDSQGWDHDVGYDGVSLKRSLAIAGYFPGEFSVQLTKDKREFNIDLDSSVHSEHGEKGSAMLGFDIQTIGKNLTFVLTSETKFRYLNINRTTVGLSGTFLGENVATGIKIEDKISIGRSLVLVGNARAVTCQGDTAYGANIEIRVKDKDFHVEQNQTTFGLSLVKWRHDLGLMANLQSQFCIGQSSSMLVRMGLNNKLSGQINLKVSSSEAFASLIPIAASMFRMIYPDSDVKSSSY